jgi:hypothetical protein
MVDVDRRVYSSDLSCPGLFLAFQASATILVLAIAAAAWWKNRIAISQLAALKPLTAL